MILEILDHDGTVHVHRLRPVFSDVSASQIVVAATLEHEEATLYDEFGTPVASYRSLCSQPPVVLEEEP